MLHAYRGEEQMKSSRNINYPTLNLAAEKWKNGGWQVGIFSPPSSAQVPHGHARRPSTDVPPLELVEAGRNPLPPRRSVPFCQGRARDTAPPSPYPAPPPAGSPPGRERAPLAASCGAAAPPAGRRRERGCGARRYFPVGGGGLWKTPGGAESAPQPGGSGLESFTLPIQVCGSSSILRGWDGSGTGTKLPAAFLAVRLR